MAEETKVIAPTTLGRYKAEIEAVNSSTKKELKAMGYTDTEEAISQVKKSIALRLKLSVADLDTMLEALKKSNPNSGKREADKNTRDALVIETQDLLGVVNLAVSQKRGEVELSIEDKAKAFDALGETGEVLTDHLMTSFSPIGGMTMLWNPQSQVAEAGNGLAVYIGGWEDGAKNLRYQYAPRKCPISKRTGYRDDSFNVAVHDLNPVEAQATEEVPEPETEVPVQ